MVVVVVVFCCCVIFVDNDFFVFGQVGQYFGVGVVVDVDLYFVWCWYVVGVGDVDYVLVIVGFWVECYCWDYEDVFGLFEYY